MGSTSILLLGSATYSTAQYYINSYTGRQHTYLLTPPNTLFLYCFQLYSSILHFIHYSFIDNQLSSNQSNKNKKNIIKTTNYNTTLCPRRNVNYAKDFSVDPNNSKVEQYRHKIVPRVSSLRCFLRSVDIKNTRHHFVLPKYYKKHQTNQNTTLDNYMHTIYENLNAL